jgi:hypothetical protein
MTHILIAISATNICLHLVSMALVMFVAKLNQNCKETLNAESLNIQAKS